MLEYLVRHKFASGLTLYLFQGDITEGSVDVIVNAANKMLTHGGGLAGIIAAKGGPSIQQESDAWVDQHGPVGHERPAVTGGGNLPCKAILHAVGPVWGEGNEEAKLFQAVLGALATAAELGYESIALPAISTGIYRYPKAQAADVTYRAIEQFAHGEIARLHIVRLILLDIETVNAFRDVFEARWKSSEAKPTEKSS